MSNGSPHTHSDRKPKATQTKQTNALQLIQVFQASADNTGLKKVMRKKASYTSIKRHFIKVIKAAI